MRVLVIENNAGTTLGQIETALVERGAEITICKAFEGEALPKGEFDGLVVLGGVQNALADEGSPYFPELLERMRDYARSDRAVLGVCLGSQLLARAFGAENLIGATHEFGWTEVALTQDGAVDPMLGGLDPVFTTFQWHDDTFVLPRGATRLAGNDLTHNQAFRIGRAAYGIQFHFEADRKLIGQWNTINADYLAEREPDWPQRFAAEQATRGADADDNGLKIARAWAALIAIHP
ncbi:type 1 glutamine amidotransferase [Tianweitania sp. BSSL-BM11]|uniref:Type 1 glutamine amidotransferase n=1 Tax=Tianweitania aestuarii TaxID=2814886 RepID=A0ABS5RR01_9HYPH|nr:type 1 glutamine amidotransferase [Tianweitania aestuarii]MBS9719473.1 type 1 glutamine amidotransferase [Tianweitania aestuarii]